MRTHVNFTRVTKIEMIYERPHVNVKVERDSTFTFTRYVRYIASILFRGRPFDFWGVVSVISEKILAVGLRAKNLLKENTCHKMGYFVRQRFDCRVIFSCKRP